MRQFIKITDGTLLNVSQVTHILFENGNTLLKFKDGSTLSSKGRRLFEFFEAESFEMDR